VSHDPPAGSREREVAVPEPVEGRVSDDGGTGSGVPQTDAAGPALADAATLPGVPDEFQRLWTPHRMAYIQAGPEVLRQECPFCEAPRKSDEEGLIVFRGKTAYALLNLFPYNSGHLLVCPYRHIATYDQATDEEVAEIGALTQQGMRVLRQVSRCDGFNIGMNQGHVAGAGVDEHLHQHIVPRWGSDANFFPIIAKTKALPQLLGDVRRVVFDAWNA
jgi:ATP adenylyltransferase